MLWIGGVEGGRAVGRRMDLGGVPRESSEHTPHSCLSGGKASCLDGDTSD